MTYYCNECRTSIGENVFDYSKEKFSRPLCISCQEREKPLRSRIREKREPTHEAKALYAAIKKEGFKGKMELDDGHKSIDIAFPKQRVNIEVDGAHHSLSHRQALADLKRTYHSFRRGYLTLRIPNILVRDHLQETAAYIAKFLEESETQLDEEYEDFSLV